MESQIFANWEIQFLRHSGGDPIGIWFRARDPEGGILGKDEEPRLAFEKEHYLYFVSASISVQVRGHEQYVVKPTAHHSAHGAEDLEKLETYLRDKMGKFQESIFH